VRALVPPPRLINAENRRETLRKMRFLVVALVAALGITAVAYAQSNSYSVDAKVPAGGTKKKPKATGFTFNFAVTDPSGNIPQIIQHYSLGVAGTQVNTKVAKACPAAKINAGNPADDKVCSSKSKIGSGSITAVIGSPGTPMDQKTADCTLDLTIYNAGGNKATLFLKTKTDASGNAGANCAGAIIQQALPASWKKVNGGTALDFDVPSVPFRHPAPGIDASVVNVTSKLNKVVGKLKGKKRGYFESIGCSGDRVATASFTDETGATASQTGSAGKC
jgi:hypothetical protein